MKEATALIKINKLLESAGWRFFADANGPATIQLEPKVTLTTQDLDALGVNFEKTKRGYLDFLLLNDKGFPFIVLEAKAEKINPLSAKEQARAYAKSHPAHYRMSDYEARRSHKKFRWSLPSAIHPCSMCLGLINHLTNRPNAH